MKQIEADMIAEMIRNLDCPLDQKKNYIDAVCVEMFKIDQFFNTKRFRTIASQVLDEGWPNNVDKKWLEKRYKLNR